ncbi:hypothetical protein SKAU_G00402700 [Synaphobranchus kaupii]|uniref:C2H2-type domain-containing protein n=1 Tax=Synaphobranchus kaupii TaxID=118154 RepID=A0A9Q1E9D5_SYNKA|nr:hypothetical protein SKAU_G00402700 [Synaphobranchus kaupii]
MIRHTTDRKDMEMFDASGTAVAMEMGLPLEMVVEEVVTHEEGGADADGLTSAMDSLTSQSSVNMLSKFGKELSYLEDSSEDEVNPDSNPALSRLYVSGQNVTQDGSSDVWSGSVKDDCLCWECGERFWSLDLLMIHFRRHEACVRCNMCQVTFRRVVSLSMHLDNVHNNVDLYCNPCRRSFHTKWDLNEHLGKHFEPSEPPITPVLPLSSANPQSKTKYLCLWRSPHHPHPAPRKARTPL